MSIKKEIEQAAVVTVQCPSCGAIPGNSCRKIIRGVPTARGPKTETHQRRLSTYVAGNIRETVK